MSATNLKKRVLVIALALFSVSFSATHVTKYRLSLRVTSR